MITDLSNSNDEIQALINVIYEYEKKRIFFINKYQQLIYNLYSIFFCEIYIYRNFRDIYTI